MQDFNCSAFISRSGFCCENTARGKKKHIYGAQDRKRGQQNTEFLPTPPPFKFLSSVFLPPTPIQEEENGRREQKSIRSTPVGCFHVFLNLRFFSPLKFIACLVVFCTAERRSVGSQRTKATLEAAPCHFGGEGEKIKTKKELIILPF